MPRLIIVGANERKRSAGLCAPLSPRKSTFSTGPAVAEASIASQNTAKWWYRSRGGPPAGLNEADQTPAVRKARHQPAEKEFIIGVGRDERLERRTLTDTGNPSP